MTAVLPAVTWRVDGTAVADGPYVANQTDTSFTVVWKTDLPSVGYIEVDGWIFTRIMLHIHENGALLGAAFG